MAENESSPPTLASLRLGARSRRKKAPETTLSLFDPPPAPKKSREPVPVKEAPVEPAVWTVQTLVSEIRQRVEGKYADLWVAGEISNLRPAPSGHVYFTLKDRDAQLPVVLFRRQAQLLRFRAKDGDEVHVRGRVSVYESRGQLQLIAETMELRGAGALQLAFDRLKARLLAEGLFEAARKRPLPAFPKCIGLITSPSGAVLQDILRIGRRRHAALNLLIYPAAMQGVNCAGQVAAGVRWFNRNPGRVDLILIARGGGSAEDLAGFNDEALARTIAGSALPVVSAVGHETDFTIADFVADLRAPTPSAAAEIITAAQHRVEERLESLSRRARRAIRYHLLDLRQRYARLSAEQVLARLRDSVLRRDQRIDDLRFRLESASERRLRVAGQRLATLSARLHRQDLRVRLARAGLRLEAANASLARASKLIITRRETQLTHATVRLQALSPLAVLDRGYALVYSAEGVLLRNANETKLGEQIRARLAIGAVSATVTENSKP
ncbi:exodeoxyribonuclease VII large subunit [Granulicella pectinivorans]|uniref:exodeoxyribonuclease VII large subunit n=1 Tax=Granulicella pectinivorans TaxID=474950 RepID=UPI000B7D3277|nr:exodeoxyribonuclease VII large subunit [Granulicella pectinivorans]